MIARSPAMRPRQNLSGPRKPTGRRSRPRIDSRYYPVEILLHLFNSLPSPDVRITAYNQSARQISVDGEASSAALAYQFIEKLKKNPELQIFQFDMAAPRHSAEQPCPISPGGKTAMMMPAWYERMNQRERLLSWIVAGRSFLHCSTFLFGAGFSVRIGQARAQLAERKSTRAEQAVYVKERALWEKRDQWLSQHQPITEKCRRRLYVAGRIETNCRQAQYLDRESGHWRRRNDALSSDSFRFHRNQKPLAAPGPFSL